MCPLYRGASKEMTIHFPNVSPTLTIEVSLPRHSLEGRGDSDEEGGLRRGEQRTMADTMVLTTKATVKHTIVK